MFLSTTRLGQKDISGERMIGIYLEALVSMGMPEIPFQGRFANAIIGVTSAWFYSYQIELRLWSMR